MKAGFTDQRSGGLAEMLAAAPAAYLPRIATTLKSRGHPLYKNQYKG